MRSSILRSIRRRRHSHDPARTPALGSLRLRGSLAALGAIIGAVVLYLLLARLLGIDWHLKPPAAHQPKPSIADQQKMLADLVKIALGLAAGIGAAFALVVAYRRALVEEASSYRDDHRLFSSRYQDAADLIGSDKPAVRLAGIYATSRLADDWEEQQQQCIDVLCAYLRLPYKPDPAEPPQVTPRRLRDRRVTSPPQQQPSGERAVRLTVIRLIRDHLQAEAHRPWHGRSFDFTGAVFDGGDFGGAQFTGSTVNFSSAQFTGGTVTFSGAQFTGGTVTFSGAEFADGTVNFDHAEFADGTVTFSGAEFADGTVTFSSAQFTGGTVTFSSAQFTGGTVNFSSAQFTGDTVNFGLAEFADGTVTFSGARFTGGTVAFSSAQFADGTVYFGSAQFASGTVTFGLAQFTGGTVDLFRTVPGDGGATKVDFAPSASSTYSPRLPAWIVVQL